jgi:hypothetical protein
LRFSGVGTVGLKPCVERNLRLFSHRNVMGERAKRDAQARDGKCIQPASSVK